jgi:hypothetical protein
MSIGDAFDGLDEIKVKKDELLAAIKRNRDEHRGTFLKAQEGYREAVVKELDRMLEEARNGKPIRTVVSLPAPSDHTKDYDRVIRMLEMSTATEIKITSSAFAQYVLDEWNWKGAFMETSRRYSE